MSVMDFLFGKRTWTTTETNETSTASEFGRLKTTRKETTTEKDSEGHTVSKTTTTEETEKEQ